MKWPPLKMYSVLMKKQLILIAKKVFPNLGLPLAKI